MEISEFDEFIDVCHEIIGMNECEIEASLRNILCDEGYHITTDHALRVGNPGNGTIYRFIKMEQE